MIIGKKVLWKFNGKSSSVALKELYFQLRKGRITAFIGPSGAGKTTLLKCIANLHNDFEGVIQCMERDIRTLSPPERASSIGFVLQQFHLFPHLSVLKNCTLPLVKGMKMAPIEAEKRVLEILHAFDMGSFIDRFPSQLSGGEQQRVAIARAWALHPKILLLDEPTSALDPESKQKLERLLLDLHERGITLAFSSHDMAFIQKMADYVYFLEGGELLEEWDRETECLESKGKIKKFLSNF